jgi:hypothetical protein
MRNLVLCAALAAGLGGCDVIGFASGVGAALIEGEHYSVEQGEVRWISYTSGPSTPSRRVQTLDADAGSFEIAEDPIYGTDRHQVFCKAAVLGGGDPDQFRVLRTGKDGPSMATDGRQVWHYCDRVGGADGATFRLIGGEYGTDATGVYLLSSRIEGADPDSFRIIDAETRLGADTDRAYAGIFPILTDRPGALRSLGAGYSTDGQQVYWQQFLLEGADVATFEVRDGERFGRDASGCWIGPALKECL